jgi:Carboxypeptidase regulatory-like domain
VNESARLRRCLVGTLLFGVLAPLRIGAQPTPTPGRTFRTRDHRIRLDVQPTPTFTPGRHFRARDHRIRPETTTVTAGSIEGRVTDRSGAPLPGVTCRASSSELRVTRETVTDSTGHCRLQLLPAGAYQIVAFRPGFMSTQRMINVSVGRTTTVNMVLGGVIAAPRPPPPAPRPPPPPPPVVVAPTRPPETAPPPEPTPPPVPRNGHPPAATPSARQAIREAYWNSWIQNERTEEAVSRVEVNDLINLNFDLAAFNYSTFRNAPATGSVAVDEAFRRELDRYTGRRARIHVKPVLGGRGLEFLSAADGESRRVDIDLSLLRTPPTNWSREDPLPDISEKVKAARVQVAVRAVEPGCASVGLSIWNAERERPIDYLVRQIRVGGEANDPTCLGPDQTKPLRGNLISLLAIPPDHPVDAALHVFEMEAASSAPKSFAVFVARGEPVRSWVLARQLSRYVTEPTGLLNRLGIARSRRDYGILGGELKDVLFHGEPGQEQADEALRVLSDLAGRPKKATVFVRLVDLNGRSLFLPLGLTAIGNGRLLGDAATVTQPLPRETYTAGRRCVQSWKMVLPEDLGSAVGGTFLAPVTSPMSNRTSNWEELESYLRNPAADPSRSEGFLLLAHQAGGRLWFVPDTPASILSEQISHRFPPGSVAVLAACSVGDLSAESSGVGLLERLNSLGVDAVIVSPFAVRGPVGARFAFHFANEVQKAQQAGEAASLVELFQRATDETRRDTKIAPEKNGVYEFLLAGNGGLRLCP